MPTTQIGVQAYTIRDHCKTPQDIARSFRRLADMGFGVVQCSALGPIEPAALRQILDDTGLKCAATHRGLDQLSQQDAVVAEHRELSCGLTAIGGIFDAGGDRAVWEQKIRAYDQLAGELKPKGLWLGYHNHSHEFAPFGIADHPERIDPKNTPYELLFELTSNVWFEIDTYWVAHGGGDPAAWIRRAAGRVPAIHVKDITITPEREHKMCECGAGNLNWPAILEAAKQAGVEYYLIERDAGDLEPFQSLEISLRNLRKMGLG